jgi:NADH:ubiquinone oxidoreductase subunit E
VGGIQAALDLAESGIKVYIAEDKPSIGGVMAQLDKTFPTNDCAMCTLAPRLVGVGRHKDIEIISLSEIEKIEGEPGNFKVTLRKKPRYVDEEKCTGCGTCVSNCPTRNRVQPLEPSPVEIEPEFRDKVIEIVQRNKNREGPLMPILQEINATFNYLPESALRYVARETGYSLTHILKIATFYSAFSITPRGKYIINVCVGTTCYVRGADKLMERFMDELKIKEGETTPDRLFTLRGVRCIGCCGLAPAIMVNEEVHGKVTIPQVKEIINKYKKEAA